MQRLGGGCAAATLMTLALASAAPADTARLLDGGADRVIDVVAVPDPGRRVGEVRLVERGAAAVVETLLDTKLLKRVVSEIRKKELANWPEGRDGHADAMRYVAALEQVSAELRGRQPAFKQSADRRVRMFIDFVLTDAAALVGLGSFVAERRDGALHVTRRPMAVLELSRGYVAANMRLIVADSFHLDGAALDEKLAPLPQLRPAR